MAITKTDVLGYGFFSVLIMSISTLFGIMAYRAIPIEDRINPHPECVDYVVGSRYAKDIEGYFEYRGLPNPCEKK